ncbi:MAG: hypothetical protein WCI47_03070, partial [bacterium]
MTKSSPHHRSVQHRRVIVDGLSYSLENGMAIDSNHVKPTKSQTPKSHDKSQPIIPRRHTARDNHSSHLDPDSTTASMHPHNISHPSLPLLHSPYRETGINTIGRVILHSFREHHDRVAVDANLISTALSSVLWLLAALPWAILTWTNPASQTSSRFTALIENLRQSQSFFQISIIGCIAVLAISVWLIRHVLQLISYAAHIRHIDNRPLDKAEIAWQGIAKIGRLIIVILLDLAVFLLVAGSLFGLSMAVLASQIHIVWLIIWSLLMLVVGLVITIHRPITRVMLAVTNQPAHKIVGMSFTIILRSLKRALTFGLAWVIVAGIAILSLSGIIWATVHYGQTSLGNAASQRVSLTLLTTFSLYIITVGFTIWSQG